MAAKKSGGGTGVGVGSSSILVIFILLCLTTFATLSMVSARADLRLTERMALSVQEYYAADARAEETLAQIDRAVTETYGTPAFSAALTERLPDVRVTAGQNESLLISYEVPVNDSQELQVELTVLPTAAPGERCRKNRWQVAPVGDWQPGTEGFELWDGGALSPNGLPPLA